MMPRLARDLTIRKSLTLEERVQFSEYLPAAEYVTKISEDFTVLKHEKMGLVCN
jgi:hypothetical protein